MKKVVIIGAGFSGITAAKALSKSRKDLAVTLIDKKRTFDFLPLIPDVISERVNADFLTYRLDTFSKTIGVNFINANVLNVDTAKNLIQTANKEISYDYLILTSGTQTNFYGQSHIKRHAYALDTASSSVRILGTLKRNKHEAFIVAGGGYTGIEVATNLKRFFIKHKQDKQVVIVERDPQLLGPLPQWIKEYVGANLKKLSIETMQNTVVKDIDTERVILSNSKIFKKTMLIWTAGIKTSDFIHQLPVGKNSQGRIAVDKFLQFSDNCFACGDCAMFTKKDTPLRMAVQFAIAQGGHAASNIMRSIRNTPLSAYKPVDLGYIVPMANNRACGVAGGIPVKGKAAIMLHYLLSLYRAVGYSNKSGILRNLFFGAKINY
ncbi:MAG: FAD-dependent oxidoreductase [Candidatus Omnitrophota bacterium]